MSTGICFKEVGHDNVDWNYQAEVREQQRCCVHGDILAGCIKC
jgi:hypothetical protein